MSLKKIIKNSLHLFGLDVHKYKAPNYRWLEELEIKTVLDIGANIGQFAQKISTIIPDVKVYSFEPIKSCYEDLKRETADINVEALNFALGEDNYETEINISEHSPSSSIREMADLHKSEYAHTIRHTTEKIKVKKLDDVIGELKIVPNLMVKIDVQGFEDNVIRGGEKTIATAKMVLIEMSYYCLYKDQLLFDDLYKKLNALGFHFAGNWSQAVSEKDGKILYSDSIFIK